MTGSRPPTKPTFLWQGVLLLLPVIVFACLGIVFLRRERASVAREAREDARALASQIADFAGPRLSHEIEMRYYHAIQRPNTNVPPAGGIWAPPPGTTLPINVPTREYQRFLSAITNFGHGAMIAAGPKPRLIVNAEGELLYPKPYPLAPVPEIVEASDQSPPENPTPTSRARIISAHELIARGNHAEALASLNAVAANAAPVFSEAGIPLQPLAALMALRLINDAKIPDVDHAVVTQLASNAVAWPSLLTDSFLDEAVRFWPGPAAGNWESDPVWWRQVWWVEEEARALQIHLRETGVLPLTSGKPSVIPIAWRGHPWFVVRASEVTRTNRAGTGEPVVGLHFYPEALVDLVRVALLGESKVRVPAYANVSFEIGGRTLPAASTGEVLGESEMTWEDHASVEVAGQFHVAMKSIPGLRVRVHLAKPELLFALQQRRERLFGGLIVASVFTALLGWVAAYRAFNRQLRLNEMKSNFVSSVSHELRAPIASVRLLAESLERGKISEPVKQNEYFRFIGQECRRLSALIENVLDFSRIEQGRKQYEFEPTDVRALVEQTVKLMEPYAAERGVALRFEIPSPPSGRRKEVHTDSREKSEPPYVGCYELNVDGRAIQQALVNLVDNAIKHSPKAGEVVVSLGVCRAGFQPADLRSIPASPPTEMHSETGSMDAPGTRRLEALEACATTVWLAVTDRGPGIPASEHERIFQRFYRLGSELRRETQGVGIGLSIVKHIAEAHGGRVRVESVVGKGSRFTIELPVKGTANERE